MDRIYQSGDNRQSDLAEDSRNRRAPLVTSQQTISIENMYTRLDAISHRLDFRGALHNRNYEPNARPTCP